MFAWIAQQVLLPLHGNAMSRQDLLRSAFCGLTSSPESLSRLVATAPPELLAALQRSEKKTDVDRLCVYCAAGHLQGLAGPPSAPALLLLPGVEHRPVLRSVAIAAIVRLGFQARGPPRIQYQR